MLILFKNFYADILCFFCSCFIVIFFRIWSIYTLYLFLSMVCLQLLIHQNAKILFMDVLTFTSLLIFPSKSSFESEKASCNVRILLFCMKSSYLGIISLFKWKRKIKGKICKESISIPLLWKNSIFLMKLL